MSSPSRVSLRVSRRQLLGRAACGFGAVALSSALASTTPAMTAPGLGLGAEIRSTSPIMLKAAYGPARVAAMLRKRGYRKIRIAEDPALVYEHVWRDGDLVMWDNRCSTHARTDFPAGETRLLRRCTLEGGPMIAAA